MWMSFQSTTSGLVVGTIMDNVKRKKSEDRSEDEK